MAIRSPTLSVDDQDYYPLHEEDDVPEVPPHEATVRDLRNVLSIRFPGWFVTGNVCIYWERGDTKKYRAPDVLVVQEPLAEEVHRVYQTWKQPPVTFVAEIGSKPTFRKDEGPKVEIYRDWIRAEQYLYADPPKGILRLWRLGPEGYAEVAPMANGRLHSVELGLELGLEDGTLRVYTPEGERLLTPEEIEAARQEEAAGRREAEQRLQAAEAERTAEAQRREEAEARAAELERQLAELRAQLGEGRR